MAYGMTINAVVMTRKSVESTTASMVERNGVSVRSIMDSFKAVGMW
jgi:hypothetical protein